MAKYYLIPNSDYTKKVETYFSTAPVQRGSNSNVGDRVFAENKYTFLAGRTYIAEQYRGIGFSIDLYAGTNLVSKIIINPDEVSKFKIVPMKGQGKDVKIPFDGDLNFNGGDDTLD